MKNQIESIRKMVGWLNNKDKDGGFWLPNIQRAFVWHEDQIERLFDSIMREYPISTLLVWKTKAPIRRRKFIDNFKHSLKLIDFYVPEDKETKMLVLDGQQRLQSLFIGLRGSYEKKELYLDILSGDVVAPEDIRYKFKFLDPANAAFPWVKLKDIVFSNEKPRLLKQQIQDSADRDLGDKEIDRIEDNADKISQVFVSDEVLTYQELDQVDNPNLYTEDDVVEIFIRANAGGTRLGKSDLLFSLLTSSWEDADERMDGLLNELNSGGYDFTRDFVLKSCLTLLGKGARYEVSKFRDGSTRESIIDRWDEISDAIKDVRDFLYGKTFIRNDRAMPSYLGLIPLIYFRFNYPDAWAKSTGLNDYILRTLITGSFSGTPDNLIDKCTRRIDESKDFLIKEIFGVIRDDGRNLEISKNAILGTGYGSKEIHLLFNLWYKDFDYSPAYESNLPQVDHIFPQSLLRKVKRENPETGKRNMLRYHAPERNQLANCMLLSAEENGAGGKAAIAHVDWFSDKTDEYLDMHLIPKDPEFWELEHFELFLEERRNLILDKFSFMLQKEYDE